MKASRKGLKRSLGFLIALGAVAFAWYYWPVWMEQRPWPSELPPSGGRDFKKQVLIDVPFFSQADPRWADQQLALTPATLAQEGCAVAAAAMVLASLGAETDPARLNSHLREHPGGFTSQGWIYWEKAALVTNAPVRAVYEGPADFHRLDRELRRGTPVILRLRLPTGLMHFVVAVGKRGKEYLVLDPARLEHMEPAILSELGAVITGMRIYMKRRPLWARQFIVEVPQK